MIHSESVHARETSLMGILLRILWGKHLQKFTSKLRMSARVSGHLPLSWISVFVDPLLHAGAVGEWVGCGRWQGKAW